MGDVDNDEEVEEIFDEDGDELHISTLLFVSGPRLSSENEPPVLSIVPAN